MNSVFLRKVIIMRRSQRETVSISDHQKYLLVLIIAIFCVLSACTDPVQEAHDEVMVIHDEVMPRMGEIDQLIFEIDVFIEQGDSSHSLLKSCRSKRFTQIILIWHFLPALSTR